MKTTSTMNFFVVYSITTKERFLGFPAPEYACAFFSEAYSSPTRPDSFSNMPGLADTLYSIPLVDEKPQITNNMLGFPESGGCEVPRKLHRKVPRLAKETVMYKRLIIKFVHQHQSCWLRRVASSLHSFKFKPSYIFKVEWLTPV